MKLRGEGFLSLLHNSLSPSLRALSQLCLSWVVPSLRNLTHLDYPAILQGPSKVK